jgi:hypothetical protein
MSIVIPTWLLWIFGGVVLLVLLFLAFFGVAYFMIMSGGMYRR